GVGPWAHGRHAAGAGGPPRPARGPPAEPLDLLGPGMPTQTEYLARRSAARGERLVPVYVPAARLLRRLAGLPGARRTRALAYRLAWATQSVRHDSGPLTQALGWSPSIDLAQGLASVPGAAPLAAPSAPAMRMPATARTARP